MATAFIVSPFEAGYRLGQDVQSVDSWLTAKWCTTFPSLCSKDTYVASRALLDSGAYVPMPKPPVPAAQQGDQTVDDILAEQMREWQARNAAAMAETQANLDSYRAEYEKETQPGISWLLWLAGGLAVAGLVIGGRR